MNGRIPPQVAGAWVELEKTESERVRGEDLYRAVFDDGWVFPLQREGELAEMMRRARAVAPETVMEIGSDKGGGFYHWIKSLPMVIRAIAVEIEGVPFAASFVRMFPDVRQLALGASSYAPETVAEVRTFLDGSPIDCLFLDGEKGRFYKDFEAYAGMVRPGGLIFVHDVADDVEPRRFFYSLRDQYKLEVLIDCREGAAAVARGKSGTPAHTAHEGWKRTWGVTSCQVGVVYV